VRYEQGGMRPQVDFYRPMYFKIGRLDEWFRQEEKKPLNQCRRLN